MSSNCAYRLFCAVILLTSTVIAALACFGNVTDPGSNMLFVSHIFSMDTTYKAPALMWRAITAPAMHWAGFGVIVAIEATITVLGALGLYKIWQNRCADEETFDAIKWYGYAAFALCIFVWGFIFQAAGGEWFASWQSEHWNGLRDATRITMLALCGAMALRLAK